MYIDHSLFSKAVPCLTVASLVAGLGLVPPAPVHGQQVGSLLEEIVVTARRREESLKDVPVAITALSGDYLAEAGVLDQYDLFGEIPGIQYDEARDRLGARPSIRGVSTENQNILYQKSSAFLDGTPLLGNTGSLQFSGVERVEVLRGAPEHRVRPGHLRRGRQLRHHGPGNRVQRLPAPGVVGSRAQHHRRQHGRPHQRYPRLYLRRRVAGIRRSR